MRRGVSLSSQPNFNVGNSLHSPKNFNLTHRFIPFGIDSCITLLCSVEQLPFSPYTWLFSNNGQCYCQVLKIHHLHLLLLCITLSGVQQSFQFFFSYLLFLSFWHQITASRDLCGSGPIPNKAGSYTISFNIPFPFYVTVNLYSQNPRKLKRI